MGSVPPNTTVGFAMTNLLAEPIVEFHIAGAKITISYNDLDLHEQLKTRLGTVQFKVVRNSNGTKAIVIYKDPNIAKEYVHESKTVKVVTSIGQVSVGLVTDTPRELALLVLNKVKFFVDSGPDLVHMRAIVKTMSIEDMHPHASYKVAVLGKPGPFRSGVIDFDAAMAKNAPPFTTFHWMSLNFGDIRVFLDSKFVSDIWSFITAAFPRLSTKKLSPPNASASRSLIEKIPLTIRKLYMSEFKIRALLKGGGSRVSLCRKVSQWWLPTLSKPITVTIGCLKKENVVGTWRVVIMIAFNVMLSGARQFGRLVGQALASAVVGVFKKEGKLQPEERSRTRHPKAFVDRKIGEYNHELATLQLLLSMRRATETIQCVFDSGRGRMVILSQSFVIVTSDVDNEHIIYEIRCLVKFISDGNQLVLSNGHKPVSVTFTNPEEVPKIVTQITSRHEMIQLGLGFL